MELQKFVIIELNIIVNKPCIVIFLIKIQNFVWWEHFHLSSEDLRWPELYYLAGSAQQGNKAIKLVVWLRFLPDGEILKFFRLKLFFAWYKVKSIHIYSFPWIFFNSKTKISKIPLSGKKRSRPAQTLLSCSQVCVRTVHLYRVAPAWLGRLTTTTTCWVMSWRERKRK